MHAGVLLLPGRGHFRDELGSARANPPAEVEQRPLCKDIEQQAKRHELERAAREAKSALSARERERERIAKELAAAERDVERARSAVERAEAKIAALASEAGDE